MNPRFPNAEKIFVPRVMNYPFDMGDEEFHPVCANEHYEDILLGIFGEKSYEMSIVDVEVTSLFVVISVI